MSRILPINIDDVLHCSGVESERVEFKATWDARRTGPQVLKTICAFANDYHNLNGGYIVIGVAEAEGRAVLPPAGLTARQVAAAQRWIRGQCRRLDPHYMPVLSPETVDDRLILVVWASASFERPHRAPDARGGPDRFWVRLGAETVDAEQRTDLVRSLMQQTRRVTWDDHPNREARIEDLREARVREYLREVRSGLVDAEDARKIYRHMQITRRINRHEVPRHIGLLCFSNDPLQWYPSAEIEVCHFLAHDGSDVLLEHTFRGGLIDQLRGCLEYLERFVTVYVQTQFRARGGHGLRGSLYPMPALQELLVNAVYHRSYDFDQAAGIQVYLYPDRVRIISYPGPLPGIELRHFAPDAEMPRVPPRNRRIGEFLKELKLTEGRLSGLRKVYRAVEANGSPPPRFDFDEQRTYFQATLPAHPEFAAATALGDAARLRALRDPEGAFHRVESAWKSNPTSEVLASEIIRLYADRGDEQRAEQVLATFESAVREKEAVSRLADVLNEELMVAAERQKARRLRASYDRSQRRRSARAAIESATRVSE